MSNNLIIKDFTLNFSPPIFYHSVYTKITNSIISGLLLSWFMHFYHLKHCKKTQFTFANATICGNLEIKTNQLKTARDTLHKMGIIKVSKNISPQFLKNKLTYTIYPNILNQYLTNYMAGI